VAITIVYRSGKKDEVLGVAAPGQNLWSVGAQQPTDRWCVPACLRGWVVSVWWDCCCCGRAGD